MTVALTDTIEALKAHGRKVLASAKQKALEQEEASWWALLHTIGTDPDLPHALRVQLDLEEARLWFRLTENDFALSISLPEHRTIWIEYVLIDGLWQRKRYRLGGETIGDGSPFGRQLWLVEKPGGDVLTEDVGAALLLAEMTPEEIAAERPPF